MERYFDIADAQAELDKLMRAARRGERMLMGRFGRPEVRFEPIKQSDANQGKT